MTEYADNTCEPFSGISSVDFVQRMESFLLKNNLPGFAATVISNSKVECCFGVGNKAHKLTEQINRNTLFPLVSVAEPLLAAAFGMLVKDGIIDFSDDVRKFVPECLFHLKKSSENPTIAIEDLLRHKSGISNKQSSLVADYLSGLETTERPVFNLEYKPGTVGKYEKSNYIILSIAFDRITNTSPEEYIHNYIFNKPNTPDSFEKQKVNNKQDCVKGHSYKHTLNRLLSNSHTRIDAFQTTASVNDLSGFIKTFMAGSNNSHSPGLTDEICDQLRAYDGSRYAMGWEHDTLGGRRLLYKFDFSEHASSYIGIVPEKKLGFALMTHGKVKLKKANPYIVECFF